MGSIWVVESWLVGLLVVGTGGRCWRSVSKGGTNKRKIDQKNNLTEKKKTLLPYEVSIAPLPA